MTATTAKSKEQRQPAAKPKISPFGFKYLRVYNALSAVLWGGIFVRLLILYPLVGPEFVSEGISVFLSWTQTLAVLEVVHAAVGLVRSSVVTAAMQIASRLFICWGIVRLFPQSAAHVAFSLMVSAWCITEVVRYSFYWCQLGGSTPTWLEKARYTLFIILYPVGALSEALLAYNALPTATFWNPYFALLIKFVLIIYPPSFYVLYTHMFKLRRKALAAPSHKKMD